MIKYRKWENEEFIKLVQDTIKKCATANHLFQTLGMKATGANYTAFKRLCQANILDCNHFTGINPNHNRKRKKRPIEELFLDRSAARTALKRRLISEGLLALKCSICLISSWLDKALVLQLDHINGISDDNRLENLRLLCPNCHSQTPTYCGKKNRKPKLPPRLCGCGRKMFATSSNCAKCHMVLGPKRPVQIRYCKNCNVSIKTSKSGYCVKCKNKFRNYSPRTKIQWPSKEDLEKLVWDKPTVQLAKELGVSDKAIDKHCKKLDILKPARGYWAKQAITLTHL